MKIASENSELASGGENVIITRIKYIFSDVFGINEEQLTPEADISKDLNMDSLEHAEMVAEFEREFKLRIPDEDVQNIVTVGDAVAYLQRRQGS
ncbi:MAG: acyl carrier protein [Bacteroidia bacterium]